MMEPRSEINSCIKMAALLFHLITAWIISLYILLNPDWRCIGDLTVLTLALLSCLLSFSLVTHLSVFSKAQVSGDGERIEESH